MTAPSGRPGAVDPADEDVVTADATREIEPDVPDLMERLMASLDRREKP